MKVYVLIEEQDAVDQDRFVIGVYRTRAAAEAAMDEAMDVDRADGLVVYGDTDEDGDEDPNWDRDYDIEEHEVQA
jgi:hypothetical protein